MRRRWPRPLSLFSVGQVGQVGRAMRAKAAGAPDMLGRLSDRSDADRWGDLQTCENRP